LRKLEDIVILPENDENEIDLDMTMVVEK